MEEITYQGTLSLLLLGHSTQWGSSVYTSDEGNKKYVQNTGWYRP